LQIATGFYCMEEFIMDTDKTDRNVLDTMAESNPELKRLLSGMWTIYVDKYRECDIPLLHERKYRYHNKSNFYCKKVMDTNEVKRESMFLDSLGVTYRYLMTGD